MVPLFCLFLLHLFPSLSQSTCSWDYDFTLEGAQGYEIQCYTDGYTYTYTPCMSYAYCNGWNYQAAYLNGRNCLFYLAAWDEGETKPKYSTSNGGQWTFNYKNGQQTVDCPNGVNFNVNWICDELSIPFYAGSTCHVTDTSGCEHEMNVRSAYACVEGPIPDESNTGLSAGSLILILSMVAFILYCVIGYIVHTMRTDERDWKAVKEHIPNYSFWTYGLCAYTKAGCVVSYEWFNTKVGKKGDNDGGTDYVASDELVDID